MTDWISTKKLAQVQGITPRAVRKAISENKYITRTVESKNGLMYEIFVPSLNPNVQNLIDFEKFRKDNEKSAEPELRKNDVPPHAKKVALARYDLVNLWSDYKNNSTNRTQAAKEFLHIYNEGQLYPILFETLKKVSLGTIYRWSMAVKVINNYTQLIPDYNYGENLCNANLTREEELVFMNLLLSPNKINIGKATRLTKFILNKKGLNSPTSERNFRRFAQNYQQKHFDKWVLAREGQKALRDRVEPFINRDISKLEVGDVLVADGHRLALMVINPFTGRPVRATLVGYLDWKSTALAGFEIMLEEDTQCVASALRNSIIGLGKIPRISYQDNGKAFKNKFFNGDLQECGLSGLFANLGIVPIFANPYNARAKIIERFFREFQDSFERLLPSFVGSSIADKPAYMMRNEKFHKANHNEFVPTIEQLVEMLNKWMEFHYSQPCPNVKGKTIGEVFNEGRGEGVDITVLDDLMLAQEIKTINRNGIRFLRSDYYNECLYGLRERVIIKYSLFDLSKIRVYTLKGKFMCEAERTMPVHPMANYLGEPKDVAELKFRIKQQKRLEKQTIKGIENYMKSETSLDWQKVPTMKEAKLIETGIEVQDEEISNGRPFFEHKYQRYEWQLKNGFETEDDKLWFDDYEKSHEYEEIYG